MRNARSRSSALSVLGILAILVACQGKVAPPVTSASDHVAPAVFAKKIFAVYEGVLPCADCQGVRTVLTLFAGDSTYKLVETYLGAPDGARTVESEGRWALSRPLRSGREATVCHLDPDKPDQARSFLVVDEERMRQLDREGRELEPQLSYTLKRKRPPV